jgi:hypothetical protein
VSATVRRCRDSRRSASGERDGRRGVDRPPSPARADVAGECPTQGARGLDGLAAPVCPGDRSATCPCRLRRWSKAMRTGPAEGAPRVREQQMRTQVAHVAAGVLDTEQRGDGHRRIPAARCRRMLGSGTRPSVPVAEDEPAGAYAQVSAVRRRPSVPGVRAERVGPVPFTSPREGTGARSSTDRASDYGSEG